MAEPSSGPHAIDFWSPVHFDELDPNGHLHNARFALHVERAQTAAFAAAGFDTATVLNRHPDLHYVVRRFDVLFHSPVGNAGNLLVALHFTELGRTSATWTFRCGPPGAPNATGTRTIVKVDADGRPLPWSPRMSEWRTNLLIG
ncbi:acyl-CoA thioester hydrolase [Saccharopolyspora kobensis]|uniref:Acyl-CoA thioester hydrolase n=1 Tax=Saccharopolyspora kobensis TaxID=146035 RepID=A0A1H6CVW4_9PSEU|nr:hotdog domain-containing protein [Saccharopolyspora kobensis]SEG77132.1 acyl-CoA thioester hydrolase [Saccharopolyspora kobensis]SFD01356.1 acyl-CoA thioester hydrolase [Saccharopolyspora kobensis]